MIRYAIALLAASLLFLGSTAPSLAQGRDPYREPREKMVTDYIEREGVANPRVLASMRQVPRHEFVAGNMKSLAYNDAALAIGHKQTISPPYVVAYMTETIDPQPEDRVLEIGTGSGYQAAVLSNLAKEVYSIEIVEPLGKQAAERLKRLGYANVTTMVGDGYKGWPEHAPFDKIIVTCSPENIPQPLVDQLKEGGRMIIPLGERYSQVFHLLEKQEGKLVMKKLIPTLFVPMTGISEERRQILPDPLHPVLFNGNFEEDANADGLADHWHYQRQATLVTEGAPEGKFCWLLENDELGRPAQGLQGMAIDGTKIGTLAISVRHKTENIRSGKESWERPALVVHFYDSLRKEVETSGVGPWTADADWERSSKTITVPKSAREMIVRVGLNGATGRLWVDDVKMSPLPR
ncbi:protein-L-isoaspartate(D-aspartate) O-methyltransferase [Planctellipticum variicoloris]|uniref:protein-L-isoaspartate(D-aspartate) O-methyltransferase n=1 Tax=Planctellipticum variicoloris TaxID=3064265 RepID=UPI0030134691|nr:protein-L-isoaspartate(D-aspartate) O-methyltransferase [Planctomycetaceae bacterium SH412]